NGVPQAASPFGELAARALRGEAPTREEARAVLATPDDLLADLLRAAFAVRERRWGRRVKVCVLQNARSGLCPEDCGYCSQSKVSAADIDTYRLLPQDELVRAADAAAARGARRYCMVTSGRGPSERDVEQLCTATRAIKRRHPELEICVSLGLMDDEHATRLAAAGVGWVNHNLNTSERFYPRICTTHTYADRVATVRAAQRAGLHTCCGGIIGMGEDDEDVVDLGFALRELRVDSLPVNFLHPIGGTPLGDRPATSPTRALRALCLMRFLNPDADIRAAGGRERTLGDWQALALYPANSIFVNGYLTTPGQAAAEAQRMVASLGFELEVDEVA
ncbi:MAG: biotin synthase BioB, partial [Thermodesulfobacteriota bacterium]